MQPYAMDQMPRMLPDLVRFRELGITYHFIGRIKLFNLPSCRTRSVSGINSYIELGGTYPFKHICAYGLGKDTKSAKDPIGVRCQVHRRSNLVGKARLLQ
jgi:hypothetical protein